MTLRQFRESTVGTAAGLLFSILLLCGCASNSLGEAPQLQETLEVRCAPGAMKTCHVWGGNKFRKRYERCDCGDSIN